MGNEMTNKCANLTAEYKSQLRQLAIELMKNKGFATNAPNGAEFSIVHMVGMLGAGKKSRHKRGAYLWLAQQWRLGSGKIVLNLKPEPQTVAAKKPPRISRQKAPSGPEFYMSRGWLDLRHIALKHSDGACCLCGRSKKDDGVKLHVDHIKPISLYPELKLTLSNLRHYVANTPRVCADAAPQGDGE